MRNKAILTAFALSTAVLSACSTTQKSDIAIADENIAPTGYWFLGDNGERQWRTLNPEDIAPPAPVVRKNYAASMGNGSGKG